MRPSTRERIKAGLASVDYVPNFFATKMNRRSTRLVGVIVPHLNDLFLTSLCSEIELNATQEGFSVVIQNSHSSPDLQAGAIRNLIAMSADGVIIVPIGDVDACNVIASLRDRVPVVFVDSHLGTEFDDIDFVGTNNDHTICLIVDYLCRTGAPPVFLAMPPLNSNSFEREQAYKSRLEALSIEPHVISALDVEPGWNFEQFGFRVMDQHFSRGTYTNSTVLCASDRLAIGAMRAAHNHGIPINPSPDVENRGFRLAGHDDYPLSSFLNPALTTVSQNTSAIASAATKQLVSRVRAEQPESASGIVTRFEGELKVRGSA